MRAVFVDANAALRTLAEAIGPATLPGLEISFGDADIVPDALPAALAGAPIAVIDHTALPIEVARTCNGLRHVVFLGTGARSYMDRRRSRRSASRSISSRATATRPSPSA
jgi:D-3-phosphoglycerate dehydrogenase